MMPDIPISMRNNQYDLDYQKQLAKQQQQNGETRQSILKQFSDNNIKINPNINHIIEQGLDNGTASDMSENTTSIVANKLKRRKRKTIDL